MAETTITYVMKMIDNVTPAAQRMVASLSDVRSSMDKVRDPLGRLIDQGQRTAAVREGAEEVRASAEGAARAVSSIGSVSAPDITGAMRDVEALREASDRVQASLGSIQSPDVQGAVRDVEALREASDRVQASLGSIQSPDVQGAVRDVEALREASERALASLESVRASTEDVTSSAQRITEQYISVVTDGTVKLTAAQDGLTLSTQAADIAAVKQGVTWQQQMTVLAGLDRSFGRVTGSAAQLGLVSGDALKTLQQFDAIGSMMLGVGQGYLAVTQAAKALKIETGSLAIIESIRRAVNNPVAGLLIAGGVGVAAGATAAYLAGSGGSSQTTNNVAVTFEAQPSQDQQALARDLKSSYSGVR